MAVPPALVRVPTQRPFAPSVASVTSVANDKGDNEMILEAVSMEPWAAAKKTFTYCGDATSSCPGS